MTATCFDPDAATVDLILAEESHLRGVARGFARCESDADDLVQDTLLRAYDARDRFEPGTSVRAWTTTILRRLFLTGAIQAKRRKVQTDTDAGWPLEAVAGRSSAEGRDVGPTVESLADHLGEDLKHALDRVPEVHRTCFMLSAVLNLSCDEIAQQLRVPRGTVMSRVHRARERLRGDLGRKRRDRLARKPYRNH